MRFWRIELAVLILAVFPQGWVWTQDLSESEAFALAAKSFEDQMWRRADRELNDFVQHFPGSTNVAQAVLMQAQARIELGDPTRAADLLAGRQSAAGEWADDYLYWTGEARFRAGDHARAANEFQKLLEAFPGSKYALDAQVGQATSLAREGQWAKVVRALEDPARPLKQAVQDQRSDLVVVQGQLLLAEARLEQRDVAGADAALHELDGVSLDPEMAWRRQFLAVRVALGQNQAAALSGTSNLLALARSLGQPGMLAQSHLVQGQVLERMGRDDEAIAAYRQNLNTNTPPEIQRQTLLRVTELWIERDRPKEARVALERFLAQGPDPAGVDVARLTLGELRLKQYVTQTTASVATNAPAASLTNLLALAMKDFSDVITTSKDPAIRGRAEMGRGWGFWFEGNYEESATAFAAALPLLKGTRAEADARFKLADALYQVKDYAGAVTNYQAVSVEFDQFPSVKTMLVEPALYQMVRAGLAGNNIGAVTNALGRILTDFPESFYTDRSVLLAGQHVSRAGNPALAREVFQAFLEKYPTAPMASEIRHAVARTYELEGNWESAIDQYTTTLSVDTNSAAAARAEYYRALDTFLLGRETNALALFTDFVVNRKTNQFAPLAQWWIADYYWRNEDYVNAEVNYQLLMQSWPEAPLAYEARMMAGRSALARLNVPDAINYFTNLTSDLTCPPELKVRAMFAYGDALMRLPATDTNNPLANIEEALTVFSAVERSYPSNGLASLAQGKLGNCYFQLASVDPQLYAKASNAFQRVVSSLGAGVAERSQAEVGIGMVLERLAEHTEGEARTNLLWQAMDRYLNVFYQKNLRDGEVSEPFWVKKAGLEAGRLAEALQAWPQSLRVYQRLQAMLPALRPLLENKILKAQEQVAQSRT